MKRQMLSTPRLSAVALGGLLIGVLAGFPALAQMTPYEDVPGGAYYEDAAAALLEMGALDAEARLRPGELATRAELVKLLVNMNDIEMPARASSFDDVARSAWFSPYFEAAADAGWVHGDNDCYKRARPCMARPASAVNRAEAATLLLRAFALEETDTAPEFSDSDADAWYARAIQSAADHCVLQGDARTGLVRPGGFMNRAEMVVMFHRASLHLHYGEDCGPGMSSSSSVSSGMSSSASSWSSSSRSSVSSQGTGNIVDAVAESSTKIRLTFDTDLDRARAQKSQQYRVTVTGAGGDPLGVRSAALTDTRTVTLTLAESMQPQTSYTVGAQGLLTIAGGSFTSTHTVVYGTSASVGFFTTLNGEAEVPPVVTLSTGSGTFALTGSGLTYDITIRSMSGSISAAHFHLGDTGVSGPVLAPITFTGNHASGIWTGLSDDNRNAILTGRVYVNVHSERYPDGEIRGQLRLR